MGGEPEVVLTSHQGEREDPHCKTDVENTRMDQIWNHLAYDLPRKTYNLFYLSVYLRLLLLSSYMQLEGCWIPVHQVRSQDPKPIEGPKNSA